MVSIRVPVSLKFDTEAEFYNNFVLDLKENKQLSDFAVNMLKAYYEHDEVKAALAPYIESTNPFAEARLQLERIQLQHTKNIMTTTMMAQHTQSAIVGMEQNISLGETPKQEKVESLGAPSQPSQPQSDLEERLKMVEKALPTILDMLGEIKGSMDSKPVPVTTAVEAPISAPYKPTVEPEPELVVEEHNIEETIQLPVVEEETAPLVILEEEKPVHNQVESSISPSIEPKQPETPVVMPETPVVMPEPPVIEPPLIIFDSEESFEEPVVEEPKPKKPASFGKLLSSTKK